ncbi:MAG: hypothetical protein CBB68_06400 [Rhodospirillaceae bacterium TMED8]|nr:MAG: hypothetical protein CBB68_06400 [Rhodospirillaceae bacterium TMED8]
MDHEVRRFVDSIPARGIICDVGGCWGWHWRNLHEYRPDITVVIVDLIRSNLHHAKKFLKEQINKNIWLVHGDATKLNFKDNSFDGYWSAQTLQHVPQFKDAIREANRILKSGGQFSCYSLYNSPLFRLVYKSLGKDYVTDGIVEGHYYLHRADLRQRRIVADVFSNFVSSRYSEILFKPELRLNFFGRENTWLGKLDAILSGKHPFLSILARQLSFHTTKPFDPIPDKDL